MGRQVTRQGRFSAWRVFVPVLVASLSMFCFIFMIWGHFSLHSDVMGCHKSRCKMSFAERCCLSLCCIRKQGSELASAVWCHVKSLAPCSPLLHISPARLTSPYSILFFSLFFFCCNFSLNPASSCLSVLFSLSLFFFRLSLCRPSHCEKPL